MVGEVIVGSLTMAGVILRGVAYSERGAVSLIIRG